MFNPLRPILLAFFCLLHSACILQARTWTSADGRSLEADFISATATEVTVRRISDSLIFTIPLTDLSSDDRNFVREQVEPDVEEDTESSATPAESSATAPESSVNPRMLAAEITGNMGSLSYRDFERGLEGMDGVLVDSSNLLSLPDGAKALDYTGRWLHRDAKRVAIRTTSAAFATPEEVVGRKGHLVASRASATLVEDHPFISSNAPLYVSDATVFEEVEWIQLVRSGGEGPDYHTTELMQLHGVNSISGQLTINRVAPDASRAEWTVGDLVLAIPDFDLDSSGVKFLLQPDSPAAVAFAAERIRAEATGGDGKRLWDYFIFNSMAARHALYSAMREGVRVDLDQDGSVEGVLESLSSGSALVNAIGQQLALRAEGPRALVHLNNLPASEWSEAKVDGVFVGRPFFTARREYWDFSSWLNALAYLEGSDALSVIQPWDALSAGLSVFFADVTVNSNDALQRFPVLFDGKRKEFAWLGEPQGPARFLAETSEGGAQPILWQKEDFNALPPAEIMDTSAQGFTLMPQEAGSSRMRWRMNAIPNDSVLFLDVESASEGVLSLSPVYQSRPFHPVPYARGFRLEETVEMHYPHDAAFNVEAMTSAGEDVLNGYTWVVGPEDDSAFVEVLVQIPAEAARLAFAWSTGRATEGQLSVLSAEDGELMGMFHFDLAESSGEEEPLIADLALWANQMVRLRFEVLSQPGAFSTQLTSLAFVGDPPDAKEPTRDLRIRALENPIEPSTREIAFYLRDFSEEPVELELSWDGDAPLRLKHPRLGENQPLVVREFAYGLCLINPSLKTQPLDLSAWFPAQNFAHQSGPSAGSRVGGVVSIPALSSVAFRFD